MSKRDMLSNELSLGLDGARDLMNGVPNWFVQFTNLLMVALGIWIALSGGAIVLAAGVMLAVTGGVGIAERLVREVRGWS